MLPNLFLLFLPFIRCPLFPLCLKSTPSPCQRKPEFILEDRSIIDVLDGGYAGDDGLAVVRNLLGEFVILEVCDGDVRHFLQNLRQKLLALDLIVRDVQCADAGTLQKTPNVLQTRPTYPVTLQLQVG